MFLTPLLDLMNSLIGQEGKLFESFQHEILERLPKDLMGFCKLIGIDSVDTQKFLQSPKNEEEIDKVEVPP